MVREGGEGAEETSRFAATEEDGEGCHGDGRQRDGGRRRESAGRGERKKATISKSRGLAKLRAGNGAPGF